MQSGSGERWQGLRARPRQFARFVAQQTLDCRKATSPSPLSTGRENKEYALLNHYQGAAAPSKGAHQNGHNFPLQNVHTLKGCLGGGPSEAL